MEEKVNQLGFIFIKPLTIIIINFHYPWPPKSDFCYGILPFYTGKLAKTQNFPAPNEDKGSQHVSPAHRLSAPRPPCPGLCSAGSRPCSAGPRPQVRAGLRPRPRWRPNPSHVRFPYTEIAYWLLANTLLIRRYRPGRSSTEDALSCWVEGGPRVTGTFTSVSGVPWSHGYRQGGDASVDVLQIVPEPSRTPVPSKCILPLLASLGGGPRRSSRSKHLRPFCFSRGLQAFAALVPGVSQVDNNSDFLGKKPHRKHPGILRLPHVRLPQALSNAAQLLLFGEKLRGGETKEIKRGQHAVMRLYIRDHRETRPHYREAGAGAHQLSLEPTFAGRAGGVAKTSCGP